jgi:hypothetical protein
MFLLFSGTGAFNLPLSAGILTGAAMNEQLFAVISPGFFLQAHGVFE